MIVTNSVEEDNIKENSGSVLTIKYNFCEFTHTLFCRCTKRSKKLLKEYEKICNELNHYTDIIEASKFFMDVEKIKEIIADKNISQSWISHKKRVYINRENIEQNIDRNQIDDILYSINEDNSQKEDDNNNESKNNSNNESKNLSNNNNSFIGNNDENNNDNIHKKCTINLDNNNNNINKDLNKNNENNINLNDDFTRKSMNIIGGVKSIKFDLKKRNKFHISLPRKNMKFIRENNDKNNDINFNIVDDTPKENFFERKDDSNFKKFKSQILKKK